MSLLTSWMSVFVLAATLTVEAARGQDLTSPPQAVGVEGDGRSAMLYYVYRSMQVDENLRSAKLARVSSLSFRRDAGAQGTATTAQHDIEVSMGFAASVIGTDMDKNYAAGTKRLVFTRKVVVLPDWTVPTRAPADFDFTLKFDTAFVLDPRQVPLWDLQRELRSHPVHDFDWFTKLPLLTAGETPQEVGRGCTTPNGLFGYELRTEADASTLFFVHDFWNGPAAAAAIALVGFQDLNTSVGLCANLHSDLSVVVPLGITDGLGDHRSRVSLPWSPAFAGIALVAQGLCFDASQVQPFVLANGTWTTTPFVAGGAGPTTRFGITRVVSFFGTPRFEMSTMPVPVRYAQ